MGIRKRKSTLVLMVVTAVFLTYVYLLWENKPSSSPKYADGLDGVDKMFAPQNDHARRDPSIHRARNEADRLNDQSEEEDDDTDEKEREEQARSAEVIEMEELENEKEIEENEEEGEFLRQLDYEEAEEDEREKERDRANADAMEERETGEDGGGMGPDDGSRRKEDDIRQEDDEDGGNDGPNIENKNQQEPLMDDQSGHVTRLIVLAYMRTGSSMTGHILQLSPDIFYVYEPLHTLERYYVTGGHPETSYRNTTMNEWFKDSDMAAGNTSALVSCDIAHVYPGILLDPYMSFGGKNNRVFHRCFKTAFSLPDARSREQMWAQCETNMTQVCRKAYKATAVKTIRLTVARALDIVRRDPKVKILHLVRDPRGILLSRKKIGYANFGALKDEASLLCGKMQADLDQVFDLKPRPVADELELRNRYRLVRYEDIATAPADIIREVYTFMGVALTEVVMESVKTMMDMVKKQKKCPTCPPTKLNSTEVAQAWRHTLTWAQVEDISGSCARVMELLGYQVKFEDEAGLRDLQVSAMGPVQLKLV